MFPACLDDPHTLALLARRIAAARPRGPFRGALPLPNP